jgi:uncharacterized protein YecT (DUF1311 family)
MQPALGQTGLALIFSPAETSRPQSRLSSMCRRNEISGQRLSLTYKGLQARINAAQRQPLLSAQRLWVQYRDAIAPSTVYRTGRSGRSRQPNAYARWRKTGRTNSKRR